MNDVIDVSLEDDFLFLCLQIKYFLLRRRFSYSYGPTVSLGQSCIKFKKFTRSSNELTFNSSSKFPSLSFMNERKERNFELELKVSSIELLLNFLNFIQLWGKYDKSVKILKMLLVPPMGGKI